MEPPDQRMQSSSTAMNAKISGVFFVARKVTNINEKQHSVDMTDKGHDVLLLTLNYAGDQLAGKQSIKLAQKAGLNFRQVVTGEEIQFDPNGEDNKRGLAGAVALYHAAAAGYP